MEDIEPKKLTNNIHNYATEIENKAQLFNKKRYNQNEILSEYRKLMIIPPLIKYINTTPNKDNLKNLISAQFDVANKYHKMVLSYIENTTIDVII